MKKDPIDIDQRKLVLYLLEEISEAGREEVDAWLDDSQENRDEYEALRKTWDETGKLDNFPRKIDVDKTWDQFSKKLDAGIIDEEPAPPRRDLRSAPTTRNIQSSKRTLKLLYAAAAVVFLSWMSITMVRFIQNDGFSPVDVIVSQETVLQDTLSDGSSIQLNENSTLRIAKKFDTEERKVELDGEAFFEVKADSTKPFIVKTGLGQVKVLGTSFQVKGFHDSDMEVFVEEGIVELSGIDGNGEGSKLTLLAGERGIIRFPGGELIKGENIQPDDLFWANKKLIFEETPLSLVFELLRKHYKSEIELENDKINRCLLSAIFNNEEVDQILAVIAISFDLSVEKDQGKFIINGKGCENE